jgi:hypothetical protein
MAVAGMSIWSIFRSFQRSYSSKSMSNIQQIYKNLNQIPNIQYSIENPHLCPQIQSCLPLINSITLGELGLGRQSPRHYFDEPVCMEICSRSNFSLAVFILPAGHRLPIHDHPQMTVLCKLITGTLLYRSFTPNNGLYDCTQMIKTENDPSWYLTPKEGNFHELAAEDHCVLFDVLLPPYKEPERCCSYYDAKQMVCGRWQLKKMKEDPYDLLPYGVPYLGERVNE